MANSCCFPTIQPLPRNVKSIAMQAAIGSNRRAIGHGFQRALFLRLRSADLPRYRKEIDMNTFRSLIAALIIATGYAAVVQPALADDVTVTKTTTKHHYVYYGDHEIYFAPETKVYYWRENGEWRSGAELPVESRVFVRTGGVELDLDTDRPYERHNWVVAHIKHLRDRVHSDDDKD
jgi:hypothetical protein